MLKSLSIASQVKASAIIRDVYFDQAEFYYSESKQAAEPIADMHPYHAANAAQKLLREAHVWANEAGVTTNHPQLWITTTKLFQALTWRAGI